MTDNEFLLQDRIQKIQQIINKYGEDNFYIAFSGGKDSTVLSYLFDMALPGNNIPRVYANTGIELNMVRDFVFDLSDSDSRFKIIKPSTPITPMLKMVGYPFKSKEHSMYLDTYQRLGYTDTVDRYLNPSSSRSSFGCPKKLRYQFSADFNLRVSKRCCDELKKKAFK